MAKLLVLYLCLLGAAQASPTNNMTDLDLKKIFKPVDNDKERDDVADVASAEVASPPKFLASHASPPVPALKIDSDTTTTDMEKAMTDLLLGSTAFGATPMGGSVKKIKDILTNSMLPKVMSAHKSDQAEIYRLIAAFKTCKKTKDSMLLGANGEKKKYKDGSRSHKSCRKSEAVKFTSQKNCLVMQANLKTTKKTKCDAFANLESQYGTQKTNRGIVTKAGSESTESYINRVSVTLCGSHVHGHKGSKKGPGGWGGGLSGGFLDKYLRAKDACEKAQKKYTAKVKECKKLVSEYKVKQGNCDAFQDTMDSSSCMAAIKAKDTCEAFDDCYIAAKKAYVSVPGNMRSNEEDRKGEWRGLHRMSCLIDSFADGKVTGKEVDACKKQTVDTKKMTLKFPPVPSKAKCALPTLYPATGDYKRVEFAPLPALAKGKKDMFKCTGMSTMSGEVKPAPGSPKTCMCKTVGLAGHYSPGSLVRCLNCKDVRKTSDKNSCPTGMKIFSPRSRKDWATFIRSAKPVAAPHFIIDVTIPRSNQCGGCTKEAMNSKNPAQAVWKTSDGSPWWLRSTPYGEPNGNSGANCYLHLWRTPHNSENNIQFDNNGCNYHSRSYYCQDKLQKPKPPPKPKPNQVVTYSEKSNRQPTSVLWYSGRGHGCTPAHRQCFWPGQPSTSHAKANCKAWPECEALYCTARHNGGTYGCYARKKRTWSVESGDTIGYEKTMKKAKTYVTTIEAVSRTTRGPYLSHNQKKTVDLWTGNGGNQKWKVVPQGDGQWTIEAVSATSRGPYLSHNQKKTVDLWTGNGGNQRWKIVARGSGQYTIEAVSRTTRGPYLSHNGKKTVDLWTGAGANQKWRLPGFAPTQGISACGNGPKFGTCKQSGLKYAQYTTCSSMSANGLTCYNPTIQYGKTKGGVPHKHSSNDFGLWCKQLGFSSSGASVKYGSRTCASPPNGGALFWCGGYDEPARKWCDWQDGKWHNQRLDYKCGHHRGPNSMITALTCSRR